MIKSRKPSAYTLEQAKKIKQHKQEQKSSNPLATHVMQLGEQCGYPELEVNGSLIIGAGEDGWLAYADKAIKRRIEQIEKAIGSEKDV